MSAGQPTLAPLTSLRFVAAAMIVVGHAYPSFGKGAVALYVPLGLGVSFFFVLSGFVLAYNYPHLTTPKDVARFLVARFARVWPLHAVTCFLWIALVFDFDRQAHFPGVVGIARLLVNLLLIQAWIPLKEWALSFNGVAWSLSDEMFFYVVFPIVIALWRRRWHVILSVQVLVIGLFIYASTALKITDTDPGVTLEGLLYFMPAVRLLEFCAGVGVAFAFMRLKQANLAATRMQWSALELFVVLLAVVWLLVLARPVGVGRALGEPAAFYVLSTGGWPVFGLLLLVFAQSRGPIAALLSRPLPVFLGESSYAIYLIHPLLLRWAESRVPDLPSFGWAGYAAFWAVCLSLAALLHLGVEKPARQTIVGWWKRRTGPTPADARAFGISSAACVVALAIATGGMLVYRPAPRDVVKPSEAATFATLPGAVMVAEGGTFEGKVSVLGMRTEREDGMVAIYVLLRSEAEISPREMLAVHLNDAAGKVIGQPGDKPLSQNRDPIPAGRLWIAKFRVQQAVFDRAQTTGVAVYETSEKLYKVSGLQTDWDSRRLILKIAR